MELSFTGKQDGNPFTDYTIRGQFHNEHETISADGFYDGDGIYRIRFMPSFTGIYSYEIEGSFGMPQSGTIEVVEPTEGNHGPVRVENTYYFSYADGTPFYPLGTTCYVWELQSALTGLARGGTGKLTTEYSLSTPESENMLSGSGSFFIFAGWIRLCYYKTNENWREKNHAGRESTER